uniref:Uncharacterized protein n=1 Tax=uncultured marine virus TaxID=186617 RepID=A0A0F7L471_9VIRU|nr:hypothetical protein [uncultured marine virus]
MRRRTSAEAWQRRWPTMANQRHPTPSSALRGKQSPWIYAHKSWTLSWMNLASSRAASVQ